VYQPHPRVFEAIQDYGVSSKHPLLHFGNTLWTGNTVRPGVSSSSFGSLLSPNNKAQSGEGALEALSSSSSLPSPNNKQKAANAPLKF
jgi:hypothetical protein